MFAWLRFCQSGLLLVALSVLSACGGGGGGGPSGNASITVNEGSVTLFEGVYDSKDVEQETQAYPGFGTAKFVGYDMGSFGAGVGYLLEFPQAYYFVIVTPNSLEYACVSQAWVDEFGATAPTCPGSISMNSTSNQLTISNATLQRKDLPSDTVTISGKLNW